MEKVLSVPQVTLNERESHKAWVGNIPVQLQEC